MVVFGYSKTLSMVSVEMEVIHTILFLLKNAILLWIYESIIDTAKEMKFCFQDSFSKSEQIHSFLWIRPHLKKN